MVDATQTFRPPAGVNGIPVEERVREERKRYTAQLQRRAQAHVTAELGQPSGEEETDRHVTMLVQHALETTGARRVTLLRPVPRGRRWHVATILDDGGFYYGLVAPETLVLSRAACAAKQPVMMSADTATDPALPTLSELGLKNYLGVPIVMSGAPVAVIEAVDIAQPDSMERHAVALEQAVAALADRLAIENHRDMWHQPGSHGVQGRGLTEQSILDLVLRPPIEGDDAFEISPAEWSILHHLNGERPLGAVAQAAGMAFNQASNLAAGLIDRGLARVGRENRRRV